MSIQAIDHASTESAILARVIAADSGQLSADVAAVLLQWSFPDADKRRMSELAAKARAGTLSPGEQLETAAYERISSFLGLVKSKARSCVSLH